MKCSYVFLASAIFTSLSACTTVPQNSLSSTLLTKCETPPQSRKIPQLTSAFLEGLADVDELIYPTADAKTGIRLRPDYAAAQPLLDKLIKDCIDCDKREMAQLFQRVAFIRFNTGDIKGTIEYFQKALDQSPNIPIDRERNLNYQVAQLFTTEEKYTEALSYFDKWEALCPPSVPDDYFYYRSQIFYHMGNHDKALQEVRKSSSTVRNKGQVPRESWGKLEMAILLEQDDYEAALPVAQALAKDYPTPKNIKNLESIRAKISNKSD